MTDKFEEAIEHYETLKRLDMHRDGSWRWFDRDHLYLLDAQPMVIPGARIKYDGSAWVITPEMLDALKNDKLLCDYPVADCWVLVVWKQKTLIWTAKPEQFTCPITKYEVKR